jgi:enterochelin esterase-like enzyme
VNGDLARRRWVIAVRSGGAAWALFAGAALALLLAGDGGPGSRPTAPRPRGRLLMASLPARSLGLELRPLRIYLPPSYALAPGTRRYPVVYLLHGGPGQCDDWFERGRMREILDAGIANGTLPEMIVIAPDGHGQGRQGRSLWTNGWDGRHRIEDFATGDVVAWADSALRTVPDERHRALLGLSDGGDAALRLMLRHPERFGAAAGLSGQFRPRGPRGYEGVVGGPPARDSILRACSLLQTPPRELARLAGHTLYFDSGLMDNLALDAMQLHLRLAALGVPHAWHLYPGWHDWPFWRRRIPVALGVIGRSFPGRSTIAGARRR